jgi:asparagine synthase (glutamine-hydrolysing)
MLNVPSFIRHSLAKMILSGGHDFKYNKLGYLLKLKEWNVATVYPILRGAYSNKEIKSILSGPLPEDQVEQKLTELKKQMGWMGSLSQCTIGEIETYTRDVLLKDTDQMSMAHALEVRAPFFDYRLIEYVLSLPDSIKYPHTPKQLLVESLAPRLPKEIVNRPKMGFTLPWEHWLKNELSGMVQNKINYLAQRPEFNGEVIQKKWNDFRKGDSRILWSRIWKLVVLSDWMERNKL